MKARGVVVVFPGVGPEYALTMTVGGYLVMRTQR